MSVPGLEPHNVELTAASPSGLDDEKPAVLQAETCLGREETLPARESPHLRFEVEDVEEHQPTDPQHSLTSPADITVTSFGYNTAEALPMTVYYRHTVEDEGRHRPTLDNLHEGRGQLQLPAKSSLEVVGEEGEGEDDPDTVVTGTKKRWQFWKKGGAKKDKNANKFGWIMGVLIRCLLNIWGVMLFIRLSWVVGQAGIGLASVIILLSGVVTTITTLSMSAICTNGEVKGGGAYYLISRSLGPEFGGAIGIIFSLANAVAVALYVVGFAETVTDLLMEYGHVFTGSQTNDIRVIGFVLVTLLLIVALVGLDWEAKVQIILLIILLVAITDFIIGTFLPRGADSEASLRGVTGYRLDTLKENFGPSFQEAEGTNQNFFTIFAVFFPAATGILAGANISGDLKNPQTAIPKGTFLAIGITTVVYLLMAWMVGVVVIRDAPGTPEDFSEMLPCNFSIAINSSGQTIASCFTECDISAGNATRSCTYNSSLETLENVCDGLVNVSDVSCQYGLLNNFQVMALVSAFGPLVTAGIFAATTSSALTSLVSAPKVFQRVCQDKVFPLIHVFAKGGGRSGTEPVRAYILTYLIALACIAIGSLNEIALIISIFFLMAYALINYSCFAASFAKSPGWRPAFKLYSKWVALFGAALCVAIMFVIRWYYALITIVAVITLYEMVNFLKPDINWGSSTQAFLYSYSMRNLLKLEKLEDHVKNFRPQFLVLTGPPSSRPDMVHFISHISKEVGIMICGQVLLGDYTENRRKLMMQNELQRRWLRREKVKAFHNIVSSGSMREGARNLLQLTGLGKLRPNTLVIGFKSNWTTCPTGDVEEYVAIAHDAFDLQYGVVIFRLRAGFDATERMDESLDVPLGGVLSPRKRQDSYRLLSDQGEETKEEVLEGLVGDATSVDSYALAMEAGGLSFEDEPSEPPASLAQEEVDTPPELITMPSRFEQVQERGYIDVWWIYDDGGLAILLPYLLSRHQYWKDCRLRIFVAGSTRNIDQARLRMTSLLRKFRISFSTVIEVTGINRKPSQESIDKYKTLPIGSSDETELDKMTIRHIRLGELLREHSSEARMIVITISVPQRTTTAHRYMSWLEVMSQDLPPILLMRGNQTSVLTFYS